jgi:hypothetical protein
LEAALEISLNGRLGLAGGTQDDFHVAAFEYLDCTAAHTAHNHDIDAAIGQEVRQESRFVAWVGDRFSLVMTPSLTVKILNVSQWPKCSSI